LLLFNFASEERRMPVWGSINVPASRRSCGRFSLEPNDSQLSVARSADVYPAAAIAGAANEAGSTIAVAKSTATEPV
jgi:hypothetical protein